MANPLRLAAQAANGLFKRVGIDPFNTYIRKWPSSKLATALRRKGRLEQGGLSLLLDLQATQSLPQVGRDFIEKLSVLGDIPYSILDTRVPGVRVSCIPDRDYQHYRCLSPDEVKYDFLLQFVAGDPIVNRRHPVVFTPFWEFQSGLFELKPDLLTGTRGAIVFSHFCYDYFRANAPDDYTIWQMPYPLNLNPGVAERNETRQRFGIPADCFSVFFNFDIRSGYDRKNPEGAMEAVAKAFGKEHTTRLVLKVSSAEADMSRMRALNDKAVALGIDERLVLVTDNLARRDMLSLIAACDVYLSLHRGEGLGLGMLEAMSLGVPVVATDYGGNTDFCTEETAFLVPYQLAKPKTDFPLYKYVREWAEPDVDVAAMALSSVYQKPDLCSAKSTAARAFVAYKYSSELFGTYQKAIVTEPKLCLAE